MSEELTVLKTVCCVAALLFVAFTITEYNETWKLPFQLKPAMANISYSEELRQGRNLTSGQQTVFMLAYYRSGSTFTASVLASYPGAFYVFEPWFYIKETLVKQHVEYVTYVNGTKREITDEFLDELREITDEFLDELKRDELHAWATCQLRNLPLEQFRQYSHSNHNDSLKEHQPCFLRANTEPCFDKVEEACRNAPIRVVKFIRARMDDIAHMVSQFPNVQFVHLLRDPRGNSASQSRLESNTDANDKAWTIKYCDAVRKDVAEKQRIFSSHPHRIYTMQYETLAEQPLKYTSEMLKFVDNNLQLTPSMESYISKIAIDGAGTTCAYCVDRGNGSKIAQKWRQEISWAAVTQINEICGDVIDLMGYKRFEREKELKDMAIPYRIDTKST